MVRAVPSISRMAWMQRLPGADQVVALGGQELEPLGLLGVLLHRERIDRADRIERRDDARRLRLQGLEIQVEEHRRLHQLIERLVPFGLDPLHDGCAGVRRPR